MEEEVALTKAKRARLAPQKNKRLQAVHEATLRFDGLAQEGGDLVQHAAELREQHRIVDVLAGLVPELLLNCQTGRPLTGDANTLA